MLLSTLLYAANDLYQIELLVLDSNTYIGLMSRVFANGSGDRGSKTGRVIPKTQKMVLDAALLNTQHYKVRVKWSNPGKGVAPSPTPRCSSYWKRSLRIALN